MTTEVYCQRFFKTRCCFPHYRISSEMCGGEKMMPANQRQHKLLAAIFKLTLRLCFHHLRMVTFSNNVEPANGFLVRYLHRKMMESENERNLTNDDLIQVLDWVPKLWYHLHTFLEKHSTSDFLIGIPKRNFVLFFFFPFVRFFIVSHVMSSQARASSFPVRSLWRSFDRGSLTSGTTPLFLTCRRGPRMASR